MFLCGFVLMMVRVVFVSNFWHKSFNSALSIQKTFWEFLTMPWKILILKSSSLVQTNEEYLVFFNINHILFPAEAYLWTWKSDVKDRIGDNHSWFHWNGLIIVTAFCCLQNKTTFSLPSQYRMQLQAVL